MATIADVHYLFVGLGDGQVVSFPLEVSAESRLVLGTPKKIALGTQPIGLACFRNNGMVCVFVASDRPAVIYCSGGKLLYANVNMGEVGVQPGLCRVLCEDVRGTMKMSNAPRRVTAVQPRCSHLIVARLQCYTAHRLRCAAAIRLIPCVRSIPASSPTAWRWRVKTTSRSVPSTTSRNCTFR